MRIELAPGVADSLRDWCREVPALVAAADASAVLHRARNMLVQCETPAGDQVVVKLFGQTVSSLLTDRWRGSKAKRSFDIAHELAKRDVATPAPLAWAEWTCGPIIQKSCYVCAAVAKPRQLRWWLRIAEGIKEPIAKQRLHEAGVFMARAHRAGVIHHDLSPGNLLYGSCQGGDAQWHFVDLNRTEFGTIADAASGAYWLARIDSGASELLFAMLNGYAAEWQVDSQLVMDGWRAGRSEWLERSRLQRRTRQSRRKLKRRLRS